jgi:putative membrane protein
MGTDEDSDETGMSEAEQAGADYRFLFANERTFLAYIRTALSLQVAGLGALQFLTQGHVAVRFALGLALVATGSYAGVSGLRRMRRNERAIRAGEDIAPSATGTVIVAVVVVVPLVAALTMVLAA